MCTMAMPPAQQWGPVGFVSSPLLYCLCLDGVYNETAPGATLQGCMLCMPQHAKQNLMMLLLPGI